jgi:2-(1,2-epoxy-1,2-dihydrophenyl)acetyl-CoA isomerase
MQKCQKPIIAAVNGVAVGAGLDLAMACDIRIASDKARFAELYIRRGMLPAAGGTYFLPRLVGIDKACQLIWTGDMIDAEEAERIGLVTMVVPHEELEIATRELAEKLAKAAPLVIQRSKCAIYAGLDMDLESSMKHIQPLMREIQQSEDHKEGTQAFLEKREPVFRGE